MSRESLVFAISGTLFGLMVGVMLGTQRPAPAAAPAAAGPQPAQTSSAAAPGGRASAGVDEQRASDLSRRAAGEPQNAAVRVELGNLYFDADRFDEAIRWYEDALRIRPDDADASTDLGIAFYYTNQPDRALSQFDQSLRIDPAHTKTMLNQGIVLAFAKQDLNAAARAWQRVVALAPDSPEGQAASRALDGLRAAHPSAGGAPAGSQ